MTPEERAEIKRQLVGELKEMNDESRSAMLAKLKSELREEIDKENLKKEIIVEVSPRGSRFREFIKHPATLLVLGFVFTTFLGTIVSSVWKYWEWENEQGYLKTQTQCERERQTRSEEIKQKYEVKDEIIKRVAETNTAAEEILLYFQMDPPRRKLLQAERTNYWQVASRDWRINEKILRQRSLLRFQNQNVTGLLEEITRYRGWVGININNQQEKLSADGTVCKPIVSQAALCMNHVTQELMPQLIGIMNDEIRADEKNLRLAQCLTNASPEPTAGPFPTPNPSAANNQQNDCRKLLVMARACDSPDGNQP